MTTSTFRLTPAVVARAKEIVAFAEMQKNWYYPGVPGQALPGDNPEHVLKSGTTRAVFSWTRHPEHEDVILRHMSVSVQRKGRYPRPIVVWTIAHLFGFTGAEPNDVGVVIKPAPTWQMASDETKHTVVVQESIER